MNYSHVRSKCAALPSQNTGHTVLGAPVFSESCNEIPDYVIVYKVRQDNSCIKVFFKQLQEEYGLTVKILESTRYEGDGIVFALISASHEVLSRRAEKLSISIPIQVHINPDYTFAQGTLKILKHYFSPSLDSGFCKVTYLTKYNDLITSQAFDNGNPFSSSRIRVMLIDDIIRDVDISEDQDGEYKVSEDRVLYMK